MAREPSSSWNVSLYLLAIFLPPLAVFFKRGCLADFWINVGLTVLGYIPGVIHAWWIISKHEGPHHHHNDHVYDTRALGTTPDVPPAVESAPIATTTAVKT
ncbi:UPF0057-domain-containing protein [Atractiella rhizophila]|nr:UPF0057-domain-containing protein [Atractiella rhizophila]